MELKGIKREEILRPLQSVVGIVERRQTLPILANVLIDASNQKLRITATDLEIQISAESQLDQSAGQLNVTVSARKLLDWLGALPEGAVLTLSQTDNKLSIKAGKSRTNLQTLPVADYPKIKQVNENLQSLTLKQGELRALLKQVEFAMAVQDIRFYLNGVLMVLEGERIITVATDGHRLSYAERKIGGSYNRQEVIVPRKTILELSRLLTDSDAEVHIEIRPNQVRFTFGTTEIVSKVIDGKFPDYNRVIPANQTKFMMVDRALLQHTLQRAAILSNEKFRGVRLVLNPGSLKIICANSEQEEAEEEIEVKYESDAIDTGFNINYLLDVLGNAGGNELQFAFSEAGASALITLPGREDYKYVVMPMRI